MKTHGYILADVKSIDEIVRVIAPLLRDEMMADFMHVAAMARQSGLPVTDEGEKDVHPSYTLSYHCLHMARVYMQKYGEIVGGSINADTDNADIALDTGIKVVDDAARLGFKEAFLNTQKRREEFKT